jgi:hypothetical protein
MSALRQTFRAGVAYGYLSASPITWKNPQPSPRGIRVYTDAEITKLAKELGPTWGPMVRFAAATGLRPDEWARLERRDVDKRRRVVSVRGTKTARSRREVPLTRAALEAVEAVPARIDTPHLFPNADGGPLNLNGFRRREWGPAVDAVGVAKPARLYDLRSTFASNALAAGITVYELARIMGNERGDDRGSLRRAHRHGSGVATRPARGIRWPCDGRSNRRAKPMRRGIAAGLVVVTVAILGFAGGVAYEDRFASDDDTVTTGGLTGAHEVLGDQQYDAQPRKHAVAKCPEGETVIAGGYILAGAFQNVDAAAPSSLPVVTESTPSASSIVASFDAWTVVAIAPSDFIGDWGVTPKAICARGN